MARSGRLSAVVVVGLSVLFSSLPSSNGISCDASNYGFSFQTYIDNVEANKLNCELYGKASCSQFDSSTLPNGLSNGTSVSSPRDFEVTIPGSVYVQADDATCPILQFTWKVPADATSRINTNGYFIDMPRIGSGDRLCRTLDLQKNDLNNLKMHFKFRMSPMKVEASYVVDIFSLPAPSREEREEGLFQRSFITLPGCTSHSSPKTSAEWTTWLVVKNKSKGTVQVKFGFANDSLAFLNYNVRLFTNGTNALVNQTTVSHVSGGEGSAEFQNVPSGFYYLQVLPDDHLFQDMNKCLCNNGPNTGVIPGLDCSACSRTQSAVFEVSADYCHC